MSPHTDLLARARRARIIAVVRTDDAASAIRTAEALIEGGIRAIELTFTTPDVERALRAVADAHPEITLGVGTITPARAGRDRRRRRRRVPRQPRHRHAELVDAMAPRVALSSPGCLTPTRDTDARSHAGAHAVKIFPANAVAPATSRATRPVPLCNSSPPAESNPRATWLDAGAVAVGIGGQLSRPVNNSDDHQSVVAATRAAVRSRP